MIITIGELNELNKQSAEFEDTMINNCIEYITSKLQYSALTNHNICSINIYEMLYICLNDKLNTDLYVRCGNIFKFNIIKKICNILHNNKYNVKLYTCKNSIYEELSSHTCYEFDELNISWT